MAQAEAVTTAAQYETVVVTPTNGGNNISTSPVLMKANGTPVQTLNDLPEGIANSDWMKKTTGRLPLRVAMASGTYYLNSSWSWTPASSGRADSPVYVEAASPGGVIISGAKDVTVPLSVHQGAAKVTADFSTTGVTNFEQLWVNGGRAVRARAPNLGNFYYVKKQVTTWNGSATYNGEDVSRLALGADPASIPYLSGLTPAQKAAAVVVVLHSWTASHHRVQEWNANNEMRVTPTSNWPFLYPKFGFAQRYFIENVPSALDAPGEWYFDPGTLKLSYLTYDSQKQSDLTFSAPRVHQLLELKGQASQGKWVEYVNFKGMRFRYSQVNLPANGFIDGQAAGAIEGAVQMEGTRQVTISDCEISRVGGYGMWMRANVRNVTVKGCEIFDTGAGGIKVGLGIQPPDVNATGYNTITGNRIHSTGFQFPGGVGVWVGQTAYNTVTDNLIGDTTYTGISVGWTWGYDASPAHDNLVARNFLYNLVQGSLSDGGGIYTLGVSTGTKVNGNVIKNVRAFPSYGAGAWGLYNDEGSSNIVMDSNIVVGTDNGGYLMHYGLANTVSNNILAQGAHSEIQVTKAEATKQVTFDKNYIVPTSGSFIMYGSSPAPITTYTGNVVASQFVPSITPPAECSGGCAVSGSLSLKAGALFDVPTLANGTTNVALPNATASSWSANPPTSYSSPSTWWAVAANNVPSRNFDFDASTADFGAVPGMVVLPPDKQNLISVIRNNAGEKCMGFQDSASLAHPWEPYSYVDTNFDAGTTTVTFTLKADATTEFIHEWRDFNGSPYKVGPRVVFSAANGVQIANQKVANLPLGQWVTVTITSRQGAGQTWSMQLKYADGTTQTFGSNAPYTTGWASTKAVYFISNATTTSTPCLGKLTVANGQ